MTGKTYVMSQVEQQDVLHPDAQLDSNDATAQPVSAVSAIMTQTSLKAGLKPWGKKAKNVMQAEMKQLHFSNTFDPRHSSELTEKEKAELLESRMFLKQKRDGKIKGRAVAGGNKQLDFISK